MDNPTEDLNPVYAEEGNVEVCPICISTPVNPVEGRSCEHKFCEACLDRWIQTKQSSRQIATCPMCRSILTGATDLEYRAVDAEEFGPVMFEPEAYEMYL